MSWISSSVGRFSGDYVWPVLGDYRGYRLNWFFPALMVLVGAYYLPFASLYGMRMFLFLSGILIAMGVVIALYFSGTSA